MVSVLDLGMVPLANSLLQTATEAEDTFPLELFFCPDCQLVQIAETVSPERLFKHYLYASSFSDTMLAHARALVDTLVETYRPTAQSLVVEIASNDGYLLQNYHAKNIPVLGIEPAENIAQMAQKAGIETRCAFFTAALAKQLVAEGTRADIMHAHNVFAHVPDPNNLLAGVKTLLTPEGVCIIEAPYLGDLVEKLEFDTIYHEHFSYFCLGAVVQLAQRHGLDVVDVAHVAIHGGSLRYTLAHRGRPVHARVATLLQQEQAKGMHLAAYYQDFAQRVWQRKADLVALLTNLKRDGRRIAAYGASAKGSTLMNSFGIDSSLIDFVVDRSTLKQGRFTPGNRLPILAPEALVERRPDDVLLLTWNFATEILAQQAGYRNGGGRFIVPLPELAVL
jgi:SAM-dependent methyltransferase